MPSAVEAQSLNCWTAGEDPTCLFFHLIATLSGLFLASSLSACSYSFLLFSFSFPLILCLFSIPPSFYQLPPCVSYWGLPWAPAASVFVSNFVLAGLLLSMAHLFAPVKEKKKKKLFQATSSVVSLGILVWIFAVRFFFFPYEVPKK